MKQNECRYLLVFQSAGVILTIIGLVLAIFWVMIFNVILSRELELSRSAKSFEEWKKPSLPLYLDIYLFNWTNSQDFYNDTSKPIMKELGPYRFREKKDKKNVKFNNHNSSVSYQTFSTFFFEKDESVGSLDDEITQLNIVALGAASQALGLDYQKRKLISYGIKAYEQQLVITKTARELLFEGYEDEMMLMGKEGGIEGFDAQDIPFDKVGWFYMRNATEKLSGVYNMNTGMNDISKLGTIQAFNHLDYNKYFSGECSKLKGSTGELFPPQQSKESNLWLFVPDMCRAIPFDYEKKVEVHGVEGYRFSGGKRALDNGTLFPENLCFLNQNDEALYSGVLNVSACKYQSPVFMSYPHFLYADEDYLKHIEGLVPNKEKHESYFTLEPLTGATLEVNIKFQANLLVRPVEEISIFQEVPRILMPVMWFSQTFRMEEIMTEQIRLAGQISSFGRLLGLVLLGIGISLVLISFSLSCFQRRNNGQPEMKITLGGKQNNTKCKKEVFPLLKAHENLKNVS